MMTDYDDIKKRVDEALGEFGVEFKARLIGETVRNDDWVCDHFRVSFGKYETDYYMGIGNRVVRKGAPEKKNPFPNPRCIAYADWEKRNKVAVLPRAADVLHSLLMGSEAIDMSFYDWCSDYGYDNDSIKARDTYDACCAAGHELRKIFKHEQREQLSELLQDY